MNTQTTNENPLGTQPVKKLLMQFAIPSIVAMLVSSLYNIVDQFFIGRNVGELGNAATNISFPLSISCIAIALLFGIGGASAFNLAMGKGEKEKAVYYIGNSASGREDQKRKSNRNNACVSFCIGKYIVGRSKETEQRL